MTTEIDHDIFIVERKLSMLIADVFALEQQLQSEKPDCRINIVAYENGILRISYDAPKIRLDDILTMLTAAGALLKNSLRQRLRFMYYRFIDQNMYDNAHHEAHCCNKTPKK